MANKDFLLRNDVVSMIRHYEDWECPPTSEAIGAVQEILRKVYEIPIINLSPCDCCKYNPPSSFDGKPCTMCPATTKGR